MNEKIEMIDEYINMGNKLLADEGDICAIASFISKVTKVYIFKNINIGTNLESNGAVEVLSMGPEEWLNFNPSDLEVLLGQLRVYKADIIYETKEKEKDRQAQIEIAKFRQVNISSSSENTTNITVNISISSVIKQIDDMPSDEFSDEDKKELKDYLYSLEGAKSTNDKKTIMSKIKPALSFLAKKGTESIIPIVLPLIMQSLM
jgi:hypothetical protein